MPTPNKPFSVTLLLWMVLILTAWGVTRFVAAWQAWDVLKEFGTTLSPLYLSTTGTGWGVVGGVLFFGIRQKKPWARPAMITSVHAWLLEYWLERILFQQPRANLPFAIICSIMIVFIIWMAMTIPSTKSFFTRSEDHEQPTENPSSK